MCRHAGYKHMAKPSSRQDGKGKAFLCATHKGIRMTFILASPSDHSKQHDAATI